MLLVTGCGRSGTGYTAKVLQAAGLDVGHERFGAHGCSGWHLAANPMGYAKLPDWYAETSTHPHPGRWDRIWHQVRNPRRQIGSWLSVGGVSYQYVANELGFVSDSLNGAMRYWLEWNELAEQSAEWTYRIEAMTPRSLVEIAGGQYSDRCEAVSRTTNSRGKARLIEWQEMKAADERLYKLVLEKADQYGYDVSRAPGLSIQAPSVHQSGPSA